MKDREPIKYITKAWVEENTKRVTKRDKELLKIIEENKIVTRDQLITLHPSFIDIKQPINVINRRLAVLYHSYCIDRVRPLVGIGEGSSQFHITLDRAGAILLGIENFRPLMIYESNSYPPKRLPQYYKHTIGIVDLRCALIELLRERGGRILHWSLEDENKIEFSYKEKYILKPDVLTLVITKEKKGSILFYEHDQGTEHKKVIKDKIEGYTAYRLSNTWLGSSWAQIMKVPTFPPVIFLTTGEKKRINWMKNLARKSSINIIAAHVDKRKEILKKIIWGIT